MAEIRHTARFRPSDAPTRILADLACPACGHVDSGDLRDRIAGDRVQFFCDCCGAFVTILLSDEQSATVRGGPLSPAP